MTAPDIYPDRYRGARRTPAEGPDELGPPDMIDLDITGWEGVDIERMLAAMEDEGLSTDQVVVLDRAVVTKQGPGMYYCGVLRPTGERHWSLALTLMEDAS